MATKYVSAKVLNAVLSFLSMFFAVSVLSFNIFTVPIEHYAPSLTSVWARGLGLSSIVYSLSAICSAVYLNTAKKSGCLTRCTRTAAVPLSAFFLLLCVSKWALTESSAFLLYLSVLACGIPNAFFLFLGIEALNAWMPSYPAMTMAIVTSSYGLSQFILSPLLHSALSHLGIINALLLTSVTTFVCLSACGLVLRFPTPSDSGSDLDSEVHKHGHHDDHCKSTSFCISPEQQGHVTAHIHNRHVMPWHVFLKQPRFYRYTTISFLGRAAMGLFPYYFKLGYVMQIDTTTVVHAFQLLSLGCILWALTVNTLYEWLTRKLNRPLVRPFLFLAFTIQSSLFLLLLLPNVNSFTALFLISTLIVILESQTAYAVILANDMFGPKNGTTVYGLATGLAVGPGEAFFTLLMSFMESRFSVNGTSTPGTFTPFYAIASMVLLLGGLLVMV